MEAPVWNAICVYRKGPLDSLDMIADAGFLVLDLGMRCQNRET